MTDTDFTPDETLGQEPLAPEPSAEPEAPRDNPNWTEAWGDFTPEPVKEMQREVFAKWDRNVREIQSQLAPFKPFLDQGFSPEIIAQAIQLQERIASSPRDFYDRMGEHWGFSREIEQAQRAADLDPSGEGEELTAAELRLQQLIEKQEMLISAQEQRYQQDISRQTEAQQVAQINAELDALEAQNGKFDRDRVLKQAIMNAQAGGNPTLANAFFEVQRERDEWLKTVQKQAPKVVGGQSPISQLPAENRIPTRDEQRAAAMEIARQLAGGSR